LQGKQEFLFEKFEIINCLKKDMQSSVYLARHVFLGRDIILKTLDTEQIEDPSILERFKREAKILANLDHDNIIKVFDFGSWKNFFYISFEYFPSQNLRKLLKHQTFSLSDKIQLIKQMVSALKTAHQNKVIHRDLKPENILVAENLTLKIADFGLAHVDDETRLTMPSALIGTPAYMAPEQIKGDEISLQSDLFSLGIIIYELFTGKHPFAGKDAAETLNNILKGYSQGLSKRTRSLPVEIQVIISHCLQVDRSRRYKNIESIEKRLNKILIIPEKSAETQQRKIKKIWIFPIAAAFVTLLVALYTYLNKQEIPKITLTSLDAYRRQVPIDSLPESVPGIKKDVQAEKTSTAMLSQVSKEETTTTVIENPPALKPGKLYIECQPWAYIFLDETKIDSTPLTDPLILNPKNYTLKLFHPDYPAYTRNIIIEANSFLEIKVDLDTLMGFFRCNVFPWAEVFIDKRSIGQTPFPEPLKLIAGGYLLTIKNPKYEDYSDSIRITRNDTFDFKFDFKTHPIRVTNDSI
jgi:serine/threonine protein kinase